MSNKKSDEQATPTGAVEFVYTTTRGVEVVLTGMPPLLPQQISDSVKMPEIPTYEVETSSGTKEIWEHDETTIQTEEDKEIWNAYLEEKEAAETLITERLLKAILLESVSIPNLDKHLEAWKSRQRLIGIELSENPEELLLNFKETEVFREVPDVEFVMSKVLELTGVPREEISSMKDSFPDTVDAESGSAGNKAEGSEDPEG